MRALLDGGVPLCFDTSSAFGVSLLRLARRAFPEHELILPAWVVAERVRQFQREKGPAFDIEVIRTFLHDPVLNLKIAPFDEKTATTGWLAVTATLAGPWGWERIVSETRPCAHRCRSGDYIVAAVAVSTGALLVTDDTELRRQVSANNFPLPGCCSGREMRAVLENGQ